MKLTFYGASDDLVEVEGGIREEYGCYDSPCVLRLFSEKEKRGLFVIGQYGLSGATWMFGVAQLDEGDLVPDWPMSLSVHTPYSVGLHIECPEDCVITEKGENNER